MDLIQPKHSYADEKSQGQIYTNTSLRTVGVILEDAGVAISLHDENIRETKELNSNIVGINLVGAPYIPVVMETIQRLKKQFGDDLIFILGGQPLTQKKPKTGQILGLDDGQFEKLFGRAYNGMETNVLESLSKRKDISDGHISLIPMYQKLSDSDFTEYFTREISLYVSQGCKFDCDFCGAVKNQKEQYRDEKVLYEDICYIVERLQKLGKNR